MAKKYLDFEGLSTFLNGLFSKFALKKHSHTKSEITDYVVDSAMSSTSTNPVQNKVINSAISSAKTEAMNMATNAASQALTDANSYTNEKVEILTDSINLKADTSDLTSHVSNTENPHGVTKTHVGLGNVPNVSTNNQTPTYSDTTTLTTLVSGEKLSVAFAKIKLAITNLINHIANVANPHGVTKAQIGLGNVENKSSATIREELTKDNVTNALGYTPPTKNTTYGVATSSTLGLVKSGTDITVDSSGNVSVNDDSHNHIIGNVDGLQTALDQKVPSTRTVNGKTLTTNISLTAGDVGADASGSAAKALSDANAYTDAEIAALIGTAPETRNTLEELSTAISEHESVTDALNAAIGNKVDKVSGKGLSTNDYSTTEKNKLAGIAFGAEVNQNAFSNIAVGSTTIAADSKTDTLTFVAGSNITLTPDATNDKITIAAKDTVYTHPTTSGNKHIPSGGKSGQVLKWSADGVAAWGDDKDTTYSGAGSSLGLVKTGGDVTITDGVITVNDDSHAHIIGNVDGLQSALDGKAASSHGTHVSFSSTAPVVAGTASVGSATTVSRSDHIHPAQTTVSGNAGSATKLATGRAIDGVTFDGSAAITHHGTCSTAAGTAAKIVSLTGFTLVTGARVCVKFTVTNTASSPTLNVNSTGAKNIMYRGSAISAGYLAANRVYEFVYDGTDWELVGDINTDTKNTAGSTNSSSKLFLVGATSQAANPQTYSHDTAYVGTDGCLYSNSTKVSVEGHSHAASNITSGTLSSDRLPTVPVAKGGTGATTAAGALTNLGLTATATELNYMDGVTSNVQTQLDEKASSSHTLSKGTDSTASKSLSFGGTFTAVTDTAVSGHKITDTTTTYTMPSDRLFVTLTPTGTAIPASADLNTTTYLKVGRYFCSKNADAATLKNCPTSIAFMMEVYSPISTSIDNETNKTWVYRLRKITVHNSGVQFMQYCSAGATAGSWTYGSWYVVPRSPFALDSTDTNGGSATLGSATQPVYVASDGTLTACTYTLGKSVPSDAKFTDTVYTHPTHKAGTFNKITTNALGHVMSGTFVNYAGSTSDGGSANSAVKWETARNINGMSVDGSASRVNYGTCSTAAATAAKTVACDGFTLVTGAEITVKFTVSNSAANPTLNVNSTGAKPIFYRGAAINKAYIVANRTYTFRYDGTNWDFVGDINVDTNTDTKVTQTDTTSGENYRILFSGTADGTTRAETARKSNSLLFNATNGTLTTNNANVRIVNAGGIELGYANGGNYIDFHWNNSNEDYTSRIIESSIGHLNIVAPDGLSLNGNAMVTGGRVSELNFNETDGLYVVIDGTKFKISYS